MKAYLSYGRLGQTQDKDSFAPLPPNPHASNPRASWKHLPPAKCCGDMRSVSFGCLNPRENCRVRRLLLKPETIIESVGNIKEKRREILKKLFHLNLHKNQHLGVIPYIKAIFPGRGARGGGYP